MSMLTQAEALADQDRLLRTAAEMNRLLGRCLAVVTPPVLPTACVNPHSMQREQQEIAEIEGYLADFLSRAKSLELYFRGVQHELGTNPKESLQQEVDALQRELKAKEELVEQVSADLKKKEKKLTRLWEQLQEKEDEAEDVEEETEAE